MSSRDLFFVSFQPWLRNERTSYGFAFRMLRQYLSVVLPIGLCISFVQPPAEAARSFRAESVFSSQAMAPRLVTFFTPSRLNGIAAFVIRLAVVATMFSTRAHSAESASIANPDTAPLVKIASSMIFSWDVEWRTMFGARLKSIWAGMGAQVNNIEIRYVDQLTSEKNGRRAIQFIQLRFDGDRWVAEVNADHWRHRLPKGDGNFELAAMHEGGHLLTWPTYRSAALALAAEFHDSYGGDETRWAGTLVPLANAMNEFQMHRLEERLAIIGFGPKRKRPSASEQLRIQEALKRRRLEFDSRFAELTIQQRQRFKEVLGTLEQPRIPVQIQGEAVMDSPSATPVDASPLLRKPC